MTKYIVNKPVVKSVTGLEPTSGTRTIQVFLNADCRLMIPGLVALCKRHKIAVEEKVRGQLVVFLNTARNYLKVIACNGTPSPVLACYRLPRGSVHDLSIIAEIPAAFNQHGEVEFDVALRRALEKHLAKKRRAKV